MSPLKLQSGPDSLAHVAQFSELSLLADGENVLDQIARQPKVALLDGAHGDEEPALEDDLGVAGGQGQFQLVHRVVTGFQGLENK